MKHFTLAKSCCTTPAAMGLWAVVFVLLLGVSLVLRLVWPGLQQYGDTMLLVALAAACVVNFGRNRTLHCGLTGPLFLIAAVVALLIEADVWRVDLDVVWSVVLIGVALALFVEWWTVRRRGAQA
jgi:hypothetical protein